jgi:hypothetical protein
MHGVLALLRQPDQAGVSSNVASDYRLRKRSNLTRYWHSLSNKLTFKRQAADTLTLAALSGYATRHGRGHRS